MKTALKNEVRRDINRDINTLFTQGAEKKCHLFVKFIVKHTCEEIVNDVKVNVCHTAEMLCIDTESYD